MAAEVPISNDEFAERLDAAFQITDDTERLVALKSAVDDWNGGSLSNSLLAKEVSANQLLQATRDNDISRWALGTATEVIADPTGQPEPGYYPIRITRSGSIRWFPSIDKLQTEIAKGDRGAEGASQGRIFVLAGGTADADPGNGKIKFNADRTRAYVDNLDAGGNDVTAWIDALDDQTTAIRMQLTVRQLDSDKVGVINIVGATTSATSYRTLTTTQVGDWPTFDANARLAVVPTFTAAMLAEVTSATTLATEKAALAQSAADSVDTAITEANAATASANAVADLLGPAAENVLDAEAQALAYRDQAQAYAATANVDLIRESEGLRGKYPNLFKTPQLDIVALSPTSATAAITSEIVNGSPCWVATTIAGGTIQNCNFDFDISLFEGAPVFSASVRVLSISVGSGVRAARFIVQQFNGSTEITASRQTITMAAGVALTTTTVFVIPAVAIDPTATKIRFVLDNQSAADSARTIKFRDMMIAAGPNAVFRYPSVKLASSAEDVAGIRDDVGSTPVGVRAAINDQGAMSSNPNLYTDPEYENVSVGSTLAWGSYPLSVVSTQGAKRLRSPSSATAIAAIDSSVRRIPVSSIPSGVFSASVIITNKEETADPLDIRFRLIAYDSGGATMVATGLWSTVGNDRAVDNASRYTRNVPTAAITKPTELVIAQNIPVPDGAAFIGFEVRVATTVTLDFSHLTLRNGTNPHFQRQSVTTAGVSGLQGQIDANTSGISTLNGLVSETNGVLAVQQPNVFTVGELTTASDLRAGNLTNISRSTYGERPCWVLTSTAAASAEAQVSMGPFSRTDLCKNGETKASAGIQFYSVDDFVGTTGTTRLLRMVVLQYDSGGAEITSARQQVNMTTGLVGLSTPTWARSTAFDLDAGCVSIRLFVGLANQNGTADRTAKFGDMYLHAGSKGQFFFPPVEVPATTAIVIGPAGSDTAAGTVTAPMATLNAAITKLKGSGDIVMLEGNYTSAQRITPGLVTGHVRIFGRRSAWPNYDTYPIIRLASKLTGITKTAGRTKVYQATVAGLPLNEDFNWAYQEGVADPRTSISFANRSPEHRGRANRIVFGAKIVKTTATTLSAALDEIDASGANDPKAFIDDTGPTIYYSIVGGGDGSAADIYVDAATGLVTSASRESCGRLDIQGLEVRYGGLNLMPFRRAHLDEVVVNGARVNGVDYAVLSFGTLEISCAGGAGGVYGDGLNGHNGAKVLWGNSLYSHDSQDDGFSEHEGCSTRMMGGGLTEYNGGTGFAPAYGADHVSAHFTHRNNQQVAGRKAAQVAVVGAPTGSSNPDAGVDTRARVIGHIAIGGTIGFYDPSGIPVEGYLECVDCVAIDSSTYGYDVGVPVLRCDYSGPGAAKSSRTTVKSVTRLT